MFSYFLPPEVVPETEKKIRMFINFAYRFIIALFFSYQCFDFLFSPIWMHGYVWALNQPGEGNVHHQTGASFYYSQYRSWPFKQRVLLTIFIVVQTCILLCMSGFRRNQSIWYLLGLSVLLGYATAVVRCLQMQQRLYSALHEGFYVYFTTFFNGLILTIQDPETKPKPEIRPIDADGKQKLLANKEKK